MNLMPENLTRRIYSRESQKITSLSGSLELLLSSRSDPVIRRCYYILRLAKFSLTFYIFFFLGDNYRVSWEIHIHGQAQLEILDYFPNHWHYKVFAYILNFMLSIALVAHNTNTSTILIIETEKEREKKPKFLFCLLIKSTQKLIEKFSTFSLLHNILVNFGFWLNNTSFFYLSWPLALVGKFIPVPETPFHVLIIRMFRKRRPGGA